MRYELADYEWLAIKPMMGNGQVMSNWKEQDAETASSFLSADALVTKLVERRKAMHEQMQKMISANEKEGSDAAS